MSATRRNRNGHRGVICGAVFVFGGAVIVNSIIDFNFIIDTMTWAFDTRNPQPVIICDPTVHSSEALTSHDRPRHGSGMP